MAGPHLKPDQKFSLEIRTKSLEQILSPLVTQITTLVNYKDRPEVSERTLKKLILVGQALNLAVERFVTVGEAFADENGEIRDSMCEACMEARMAGAAIQSLTDITHPTVENEVHTFTEKTAMVRAARQLLSAITKVLLLADRITVKEILISKEKVSNSIVDLENVRNFREFIEILKDFGQDMVQLAKLTGNRQQDLKSSKQSAQMQAARTTLEKSTMMLLPACKTCLRHPNCETALRTRDGLFKQMRKALDQVQHIVSDGVYRQPNGDSSPTANGDSGIGLSATQPTAHKIIREFADLIEMTRITLVTPNHQIKLSAALECLVETTQDFTDSAYTSHEHREKIIELSERLRMEVDNLLRVGKLLEIKDSGILGHDLEASMFKTSDSLRALKKQLQDTAMDQASELFRTNEDREILMGLKTGGMTGKLDLVDELSVKFEEHSEQLEEVAKLLRHIAGTDVLMITAEHAESVIKSIGPLTLYASQTLAQYPDSKIAEENLDVFAGAWETQINELSILVKEINDVCQGKMEKTVYLSLPRPGKYGTRAASLRPVKLDAEEQARIAKLGLEMKLITSEMDAETEKWEDSDNAIVKRAKNMSSMAFSMYLFTRGEGPLKTTQDLFMQADYFAEEGNKLFKVVRDFSQKVPAGANQEELTLYLEKIPEYCQQLQTTLKAPTFGKAATFNKVDGAIQETKNLMNIIAKVITSCFFCATKYSIEYCESSPQPARRWRQPSSSFEFRSNSSDNDSVLSTHSDGLYRSSSLQRSLVSYERF